MSGDFFSSLADYSVPNDLSKLDNRKLCKAEILFIPSHHVGEILGNYESLLNCKVLLAGNSDFEFRNTNLSFPKNMKYAFLQNSFISDDIRIFTIPIGIENMALARNGFKSTMRKTEFSKKLNKVLIGPFGPTSQERIKILELYLNEEGPWDVITSKLPPYNYPKIQTKYKYVLCPSGNGVDTHRIWETIYRGSIPIVADSRWSRSLSSRYPIVLVKSLIDRAEIQNLVESDRGRRDLTIPQETFGKYWRDYLKQSLY